MIIGIPFLSVMLAFLASAPIFAVAGADLLAAYSKILSVFISPQGFTEAWTRAIPILFAGLGLCLAFKIGFWNIGAEGQLHMGAWFTTLMVLMFTDLPAWGLLPLMLSAAFFGGGIWGLLPAILKVRLQVNEVLTTLMMNFIAGFWVLYWVYGPWRDPKGLGFPLTPPFPEAAILPSLPGTRVHAGLIIAVVAAVAVYFFMYRTTIGFELKVTGESLPASKYAGMSYTKLILLVLFISGGLAGLAGLSLVSGVVLRLRPGISPGYGFTAIIIAWLSRLNPLVAIPVSFLFGGLLVAGDALQIAMRVPVAIVFVFQALVLIFIVGAEILSRYKITVRF